MLENELESIFSAGKVAMKSIFKEEDEGHEDNKADTVDDSTKQVGTVRTLRIFSTLEYNTNG